MRVNTSATTQGNNSSSRPRPVRSDWVAGGLWLGCARCLLFYFFFLLFLLSYRTFVMPITNETPRWSEGELGGGGNRVIARR